MAKWIKNTDTIDHTWVGQLVEDGTYYEIQSSEEVSWANNSQLLTDIGSGKAVVAKDDSGTTDITDVATGINYLKGALPTEVSIQEENIKTGGHYQSQSFEIDCDQSQGTFKNLDITFPIPISLLSAEFTDRAEYRGDECECLIAPDTIIGTLTVAASTSDTVLDVAQSVIDNIQIGYWCTINTFDAGRVTAIDKVNKQITVETGMDQGYAIGTLVKMTVKMLPHLEFNGADVHRVLGESKIGGSYVTAGTVIRFRYKRNDADTTKRFSFVFEYLY